MARTRPRPSPARPRYVPDRGDVIWVDFSPNVGREQAGRRPALVLSPADYNGRVGLLILCPITSAVKGYPWEVALPDELAGQVQGVILADQIKNFDWRGRNADFCCRVPAEVVQEVLERIYTLLESDDDGAE